VAAFRLSAPAEAALDDILKWSAAHFHEAGRRRYAALLVQAMQDVADDPERPGITWVRIRQAMIGLYHLRHSRGGFDPVARVNQPRHLVVFRIGAEGIVDVLGFIHERMLRDRALRRLARQTD
jgi:toxin ParE1/3/4